MSNIDLSQLSTSELEQYLKEKKQQERLQKIENQKALSELENDFIDKYLNPLFDKHNSVEDIVNEMFKDFELIKPLKAEVKGAKVDKQYSHTFTHSDKDRSIIIGYNYTPAFDGSEVEGITIIKNFLATLDEDSPKLKLANKIIGILLKTNPKTGELNVSKALELNEMRSDFNSEDFDRGMDLLLEARYNKLTSCFVSGWKNVIENGRIKTLKFRFSV